MKRSKGDEVRESAPKAEAKSAPRDEAPDAQGRVPRLRFPEFRDAESWQEKSLGAVTERLVGKVGVHLLPTVSITAGLGFVLQQEKFGRDISGDQYANYIKLSKGDFAFNKGNSKRFPQGCIYELVEHKMVAAPNAFICFRFMKKNTGKFFIGYFEQNRHGSQLIKCITSGARSDGLLNIDPKDFFSIKFSIPEFKEQYKIAACLSSLDDLIATHTRKLEALIKYKKGLMQQLFSVEGATVPRLRFAEFRDVGEWKEKRLEKICSMQAGKFIAGPDIVDTIKKGLFPCYGGNGLRGYTKTKTHAGRYPLIGRQGALCGNITLADGIFHATEHAVVCSPEAGINVDWLYYQLVQLNLNQYATGQAQPGLSVESLEKVITSVPSIENEQQKVASTLSSLDDLITAQAAKVEELKQHKRGLMQGLFPAPEEEF